VTISAASAAVSSLDSPTVSTTADIRAFANISFLIDNNLLLKNVLEKCHKVLLEKSSIKYETINKENLAKVIDNRQKIHRAFRSTWK